MRIEVVPGKVKVVAPFGTSTLRINRFVNSKQEWISKRLSAFEETESLVSISERDQIYVFGELMSRETVMQLASESEMDLEFWLDSRLMAFLQEILLKYPTFMPKSIRLGKAKTRWGSCSSKGVIMINRKLVHAPPTVIEYVLVHELAHLIHRNHSSAFWLEVRKHLGSFRDQKKWLKEQGAYL